MSEAAHQRFAPFVATLGRGPGRSRALTRAEAAEAFAMVLAGTPDPHQVGAFLMLLRYRGEDAAEIAGLVEAARAEEGLGRRQDEIQPALDWPSYGAGKSRGAPWFLLAALALARSGIPVLMHGTNAFSTGMPVADGLAAIGLAPCRSREEAAARLAGKGFAYLPIATLAPRFARLLGLRSLFGLRSPVNTVSRLLDPFDAAASLAGVFHPPYIRTHLATAALLARPRTLVLKGGGGEAERNPAKPVTAHLLVPGAEPVEIALGPLLGGDLSGEPDSPALFAAIWRGERTDPRPVAIVQGAIALGLLAMGRVEVAEADAAAAEIWRERLG
jgi:anthranilate phosphoribosyltransferase